MIKYLISTLEYLVVAGVLLGMMLSYIYGRCGSAGRRIVAWGALAGAAGAAVMAYLKNKTKLIDQGNTNMVIFSISLVALVLFLILDLQVIRKKNSRLADMAVPVFGAVLMFIELFYSLPDVLAYPYTIVLGGDRVFSTGFLYRLIGAIIAILLTVLTAFAAHFVCRRIRVEATGLLLKVALIITGLQQTSKVLQTLLTRRYIHGKMIFKIIKFTSNNSNIFIYGVILAVFFLPLVLWIRSFHVNEPYRNPAEHRKIRAKWRSIRRWSTALIVCLLLVLVNITAVKAYANRPVELSPVEECELRGDSLYIPFEQVEDGHLHRFAYKTDKDVAVRFIVIKKPNSTAYGVGLDACDICGETGYYERDGQVVCNRCDVVMNISTIGFKGGCNPKVIEYKIDNGYIIVPVSTLIEHESDFS